MQFLPEDYKEPGASSNYLRKFEEGKTRFRITSSCVIGFQQWYKDEEGEKKVARARVEDKKDLLSLDNRDRDPQYFWSFTAWNRDLECHQLVTIAQFSIRKRILELTKEEDWGDPVGTDGYEIVIGRKGSGKQNTEYTVTPGKSAKLDKEVLKQIKGTPINLEAIFTGEDPFESVEEEVKPEDVAFD